MTERHVMPTADLIGHQASEDCTCGPTPELVKHEDGTDAGWIYIHHSLNGREQREPR